MKAVRINATGNTSVLNYGDYEKPEVGDNDVLVKVMATSVSGWDIKYRRGDLFGQEAYNIPGRSSFPLPQQLGREATGIVVHTGKNITNFKINDRVLGLVHPENQFSINSIINKGNLSTEIDYPGRQIGSYAQYVARPEHYWMKLPENVSFDQVAAGAWSYPTSHRIIFDRCKVSLGDTVLITVVSGGIGNALLSWSHLAGARVIGTTTNQNKIEQLKQLGVDEVIVTSDINTANEQLKNFTNGLGVNHAIELTGDLQLKHYCLNNLACGSTFCPLGESVNDDSISLKIKQHLVALELTVVGIT